MEWQLARRCWREMLVTRLSKEIYRKPSSGSGGDSELTAESVKVAEQHQSDSVSQAYVDEARAEPISGKPAIWERILGGFGWILIMVGIGGAANVIHSGHYST